MVINQEIWGFKNTFVKLFLKSIYNFTVVKQKINNFNSVAVNKKDNYCRKRTEAVEQSSHFWHFSKNYQYANQSNLQNKNV